MVLELEVDLERDGPAAVLPRIETLLQRYPGTSALRFIRANALAGSGRIDEALRALSEQARDEPLNPEPHYGAAQILQQVGRIEEARAAYEAVLARSSFCAPIVIADVRARLETL